MPSARFASPLHGAAVALLGTAVAPLGTAVVLLGTAVAPLDTAVVLLGTAVSLLGTAVSLPQIDCADLLAPQPPQHLVMEPLTLLSPFHVSQAPWRSSFPAAGAVRGFSWRGRFLWREVIRDHRESFQARARRDDDTSSVVDGCAEPSVDGMASQESDVIA